MYFSNLLNLNYLNKWLIDDWFVKLPRFAAPSLYLKELFHEFQTKKWKYPSWLKFSVFTWRPGGHVGAPTKSFGNNANVYFCFRWKTWLLITCVKTNHCKQLQTTVKLNKLKLTGEMNSSTKKCGVESVASYPGYQRNFFFQGRRERSAIPDIEKKSFGTQR